MAKKPLIAVDIDEVLVPNFSHLADHHNRLYGTNHTVEDYSNDWAKIWGVTGDELERRATTWKTSQDWIDRHEIVLEGALETLQYLKKHYRLAIVTGRSKAVSEFTEKWLEEKFPQIFDHVRFVGLFSEGAGTTKADTCLEIGADYLVDDDPVQAMACAKAGLTVLLFGDYAWNRHEPLLGNMKRVKDWQAVKEYFDAQN